MATTGERKPRKRKGGPEEAPLGTPSPEASPAADAPEAPGGAPAPMRRRASRASKKERASHDSSQRATGEGAARASSTSSKAKKAKAKQTEAKKGGAKKTRAKKAQATKKKSAPRARGGGQRRGGGRAAATAASDPGACPLTGLPKGDAARAVWRPAVDEARAGGLPCALGLLDVDDFSGHTERLGVARADALLEAIVTRLREVLSDQALFGRLAGDLLGVALPGVEVEPALALLERARAAVAEQPFKLGRGAERRVVEATLSAGVAGLYRDADDLPGLLEQARIALWRAKDLGGNRLGLPARERMVLKTSYYPQSQLEALKRLAARRGVAEAVLLREALGDLLLKYKDRRPAPDEPPPARSRRG